MNRLLIKFFSITAIIILFLYIIQYFTTAGLRKSESAIFIDWNRIYDSKINADVLMCGNSTTQCGLSPTIFDSILHLNTYNIALNGWTFEMQQARLKIYLQHNTKPKYILQGIDFGIFDKRTDLWQREQFLPYLFDSIIFSNTQQYKGKFSFAELYFPLFKFNRNVNIIINGIASYFGMGSKAVEKNKGYVPHDILFDGKELEKLKHNVKNGMNIVNREETKNQFIKYIHYCNENDIKLIIEFMPLYHDAFMLYRNSNAFKDTLKKYANENNIPFLDYSCDSITYNTAYFYNGTHLNKNGSELFSLKFANDLKKIIH